MARGGYYIATDTRAFVDALRDTEHGLKDLRAAYREMARWLGRDVQRFAPVYGGQHSKATKTRPGQKDGRGHPPPGNLKRTIEGNATIRGPWVQAGGHDASYATLQEWGGKSVWRRGGAKWSPTKKSGRATGSFTVSHKKSTPAHVVYTKPRVKFGYFIWNAGYRNRQRLGMAFYDAIAEVAARHGLDVELPADPSLDLDRLARDAA